MSDNDNTRLAQILAQGETELLSSWTAALRVAGGDGGGRIGSDKLQTECRSFIAALRPALSSAGGTDLSDGAYRAAREFLAGLSASRAVQGFTPTETASFVFSLKEPVFKLLQRELGGEPQSMVSALLHFSTVIDQLGIFTTETFQKSREEVIVRQQQEIAELSTPVVKLWDGVLALPLIGTLDSVRTQVVMENLLQSIVEQEAEIAIVDITGVPTVDTLVAQHLLKTIAAARLMGADCIISGIRPQIAQTMVHLGVELTVVSKASLADAFALALQRTGKMVVSRASAKP